MDDCIAASLNEEFHYLKVNNHNLPFYVYNLTHDGSQVRLPAGFSLRDFYKIALVRGENRCHVDGKIIPYSGSTLIFFTPNKPYTWEPLSDRTGYFCIFKESFFMEGCRKEIKTLPMYAPEYNSAYILTPEMDDYISSVYEKMLAAKSLGSPYAPDLSRAYITEIIYFALTHHPADGLYRHSNAKIRLTKMFFEQLERQFNISSDQLPIPLRSAKQYAAELNVHINHLNDAVKKTTGKTTTQHITERTSIEAQILLKNTNLNISEIGYRFGFENSAHFFNFFKKVNGLSPSEYRKKFGLNESLVNVTKSSRE